MGQSHAGWEVGGREGVLWPNGPFPSLEEGDGEGGSPHSTRWFPAVGPLSAQHLPVAKPSTALSP